jgi:hypothetical protein
VSEEQRNYAGEPEGSGSGGSGLVGSLSTTTLNPRDEKTWSVLAHLSVFLNLFTGFLGPVAALVIWLVYRDRSPRVSFHALQSVWYQVAWLVILAVGLQVRGKRRRAAEGTNRPHQGELTRGKVLGELLNPGVNIFLLRKSCEVDVVKEWVGNLGSDVPAQARIIVVQLRAW